MFPFSFILLLTVLNRIDNFNFIANFDLAVIITEKHPLLTSELRLVERIFLKIFSVDMRARALERH